MLYSNFVELTVRLGTGDDTVYVAPHPYTSIVIDDPNAALRESTDFLGLAFAHVTNPVFTSTGTNSGSYTFDDAAPVSYAGIEMSSIDAVAPEVVTASFEESPIHRLLFQFSEDLSAILRADDLVLTHRSTGQPIDPAAIALWL